MANGIEQKGIDTLQQCIKKCAAAGLGIPATVRSLSEIFGSVSSQVAIKTTRYFTTSVNGAVQCSCINYVHVAVRLAWPTPSNNIHTG